MVGKASLHRHRVQANKTSGPNTLSFFKKRAEFSSDQEYGNYVRANIKPSLIVQYMGHVFGFAFQCQFEFLQCNDTYKLICPWWVPRKPTWTLHRSGSNHLHRDSIRANVWESNVARVRVCFDGSIVAKCCSFGPTLIFKGIPLNVRVGPKEQHFATMDPSKVHRKKSKKKTNKC